MRNRTRTRMRARPHTLLTNRYMTPFDPPKNPVARVSHFHYVSHTSHKYINSLCTYFHLHSHCHTTLFALNHLNGSCFMGRGLLRPSLLKLLRLLENITPITRNENVLPLKQSSWDKISLFSLSSPVTFIPSKWPLWTITIPQSATQHPIHDTAYSTVFMLKEQQKIVVAIIIIIIIIIWLSWLKLLSASKHDIWVKWVLQDNTHLILLRQLSLSFEKNIYFLLFEQKQVRLL